MIGHSVFDYLRTDYFIGFCGSTPCLVIRSSARSTPFARLGELGLLVLALPCSLIRSSARSRPLSRSSEFGPLVLALP